MGPRRQAAGLVLLMRGLIGRTLGARPQRQRQLLTLAAAALALAGLLAGGGNQIVKSYESLTSTDRLIELSALLSGTHESARPVTLLEIDDETRQHWRSSLVTPRPAIARLIDLARSHGALVVLVDLDLSSDDPAAPADPDLSQTLSDYPTSKSAPVLMLVRSIGFRNEPRPDRGQAVVAATARATPYDRAVADKSSVLWVSALPELGKDRVVRKVRLWQTVCDGKRGIAFASPALATVARLRLPDLQTFLKRQAADDCGDELPPAAAWPPLLSQSVDVPYTLKEGSPSRLLRIGAWRLVSMVDGKAALSGEADAYPFKERLVVIGATHADARDFYVTPVGSMSGAVILANTMAMAHPMVETPKAPVLARNLLAIGLFGAFAIIAAYLHVLIAAGLIGAIGLSVLMACSRILGFGAAVEIVALGLTLFALFKILDAAAGIVFDWRHGLGWRALLKERPKAGVK